ncbi:uncharacterized protein FOMMEDRAFT_147997 [Fomitiporia mediterranea MF3/22]|uniref:uncharacterized protein n=1 Tax=Fomitiporia mediterranea (strain MF3/22) TaxID=694068 RepID=UPI000440756B|nr:uncharacterized protein FOMMEDRAFT_147997 [Fomitiporia mediterranea MF3/22]EJD01506.1 hypothetical protein FOMMEDRAFT_147997 [Fomitiporia mediterranea MF3/22]
MSKPPEGDISKPSPVDRVLDSFVRIVTKMFNSIYPEQAKRLKEFEKKASELTEVKLGPEAKKMFCVTLLATKPVQQGKKGFRIGFAQYHIILCRAMLPLLMLYTNIFSRKADIRGRSVYLFSSNLANVAYYESFGFVRTADVSLGDDNPKWNGPPVIVPLMVREARKNT